ncbi:MAG TPA: hypothetical protein PLN83_10770, partial [Syntrophorhabdus sp.]|nr:hypothetical protein [Syntrophorhabdus sp.]
FLISNKYSVVLQHLSNDYLQPLFVIHELILLSVANFLNTAGKAQWFRYFFSERSTCDILLRAFQANPESLGKIHGFFL